MGSEQEKGSCKTVFVKASHRRVTLPIVWKNLPNDNIHWLAGHSKAENLVLVVRSSFHTY